MKVSVSRRSLGFPRLRAVCVRVYTRNAKDALELE